MKNKNEKAVALSYSLDENAPKVVAKGEGEVAKNIIRKAKESDVTIYQDSKLVENLIQLNLNEEIPEELYQVVAEIIFYVYSIDESKRKLLE